MSTAPAPDPAPEPTPPVWNGLAERITVVFIGVTAIVAAVGSVGLAIAGKSVPEGVPALAATCVAGLIGLASKAFQK